jgi:hypothetical protein
MKESEQSQEIIKADALFSPCRAWRYTLLRRWNPSLPSIAFIGANPSTADETVNDHTIRRCIQFAKDWGYGEFLMLNLFGYRSTKPVGLFDIEDPVGPCNDLHIDLIVSQVQTVCIAWGSHDCVKSILRPRAEAVLTRLSRPMCLGVNADGAPKHPLYLKKALRLMPYLGSSK